MKSTILSVLFGELFVATQLALVHWRFHLDYGRDEMFLYKLNLTYYRFGRTNFPFRSFNLQLQYSAPGMFSDGGTGVQAGSPF